MQIRKDWKFLYLVVLVPALVVGTLLVRLKGGNVWAALGQIWCAAVTFTLAYDAFKNSEPYPIPKGGLWKTLLVVAAIIGFIGLATLNNVAYLLNSVILVIYLAKVWKIRKRQPNTA